DRGGQPVERLDPRAVGRGLREVVAAPDKDERALLGRLPAQRLGQGGLADARLAADEHQRPTPGQRRGQGSAKERQLALAPDERWPWGSGQGACGLVGHRRLAVRRRGSGAAEYSRRQATRCPIHIDRAARRGVRSAVVATSLIYGRVTGTW